MPKAHLNQAPRRRVRSGGPVEPGRTAAAQIPPASTLSPSTKRRQRRRLRRTTSHNSAASAGISATTRTENSSSAPTSSSREQSAASPRSTSRARNRATNRATNRAANRATNKPSSRAASRRPRGTGPMRKGLLGGDTIAAARQALLNAGADSPSQVGEHIGVITHSDTLVTHRFAAAVPGYQGWEWNVVVATVAGTDHVTINETALVAAKKALTAPEWVPYAERLRKGDLGPKDVLPPEENDPRLRHQAGQLVLSNSGLKETATRWRKGRFGPTSAYAREAQHKCTSCAFFVPLTGNFGNEFGACANGYAADGHVVHRENGCGAHSETLPREAEL